MFNRKKKNTANSNSDAPQLTRLQSKNKSKAKKNDNHLDIGQKLMGFRNIFKLDRHGVMARGGILFGSAVMLMMIGVVTSYFHDQQYQKNKADTLTSYASQVSFSKTNDTTLTLHKIQLSDNRHTAYVPFSMSSMDSVSSNANKYTVLVGAANGHMRQRMIGQMVLFGTTARGAVVLHEQHKISNQPIEIIMRSNLKLDSEDEGDTDVNTSSNNSSIKKYESEYNALDFKVNPGAKSTQVNPKLSTGDHLSDIYKQLFGVKDMDKVYKADRESKKHMKGAYNTASENSQRLTKLGFRLPHFKGGYGKNHTQPKWMNPKWRPYDYIMKNGIPFNKRHKANAKNVKDDAAYSPVGGDDDEVDSVTFPPNLKKKDGTTTDDSNQSSVQSNDNNGDNGNSSGSGSNSGQGINGGDVDSPSKMWSNLTLAWNEIRSLKHNIFTTNASTLFKIKATIHDVNEESSVGTKKHFKQVN